MIEQSITQIQRTSKRFRLLFAGLTIVVPLLNLIYWLSFNHLPEELLTGLPVTPNQDLPPLFLGLALLVSMIPISVAMYGFRILTSLFRLYENGHVFTSENVHLVRKLGYVVIAWVFASFIFAGLISLVVTHGLPHLPTLALEVSLSDFLGVVMGAIVVLISKVMDEGRRLEDQQMYTV